MYKKYTGIILKKYPLGEADELITIFTKEAGKIRVVARSTRKIQSKLAGPLQSLNEVELETAGRGNRGPGGIPVLISVRALSINSYLRNNLKKYGYALVGAETLYRITPDQQPQEDAYVFLQGFLSQIGDSANEPAIVRTFQMHIAKIMGFGLDVDRFGHLSGNDQGILRQMYDGQLPEDKLPTQIERAVENTVEWILEREIKSTNFLDNINHLENHER